MTNLAEVSLKYRLDFTNALLFHVIDTVFRLWCFLQYFVNIPM